MRDRGVLLLDAAGLLGAAAWSALAWRSHGPPGGLLIALLAVLAAGWLALGAGRLALGSNSASITPRRAIVLRILFWGLVFRAAGWAAEPVLEDDWYRYLWDGHRFAQAGTPYGEPPLARFDDPMVPPQFDRILDGINNPDLPTIYGPVPQFAFLAAYLVAPASLLPLKVLLTLAELLTALLLLWRWRSAAACLLWFWCPLLIQESAFNAHPEALGLLGLVAALAWAGNCESKTAVAAAVAAAARPFGAVLAPFLLSWRRPGSWLVFGATLTALYLPFVARGGVESVSLAAMAQGWEFNSSAYAVLSWMMGAAAARWASALLFGAAYLAILCLQIAHRAAVPRGDLVLGVLFLLSPVVNPWYLLWLLPFAILRPSAWIWTALGAMSLSYAHGYGLGDPSLGGYEHPDWLRLLEFGAVGLALCFDASRTLRDTRRRTASGQPFPGPV